MYFPRRLIPAFKSRDFRVSTDRTDKTDKDADQLMELCTSKQERFNEPEWVFRIGVLA